ncbi:MAG TPA: hypothetical protein VFM25_12360 [Verrucomicrobiae bacterium]|nr:hypothetical protein [Verrucomicrobiae bacterium]
MKTKLAIAVFTSAMTLSGFAQFYVAGDFNGWSANGTLMTETSTGSGIWQATIAGLGNSARHEFKITDGAWDGSDKPAANSWLYSDADGNVTITYDTNNHSDGWENSIGRIGVSLDPGTWTAVGDWQG